MYSVNFLQSIGAVAPDKNILFRLGYKTGITQLSPEDKARIDSGIKQGRLLCALKGAYLQLKITRKHPNAIQLENGIVFESTDLSNMLLGSSGVMLMGATAGKEVVVKRDKEMLGDNAALGVIIDAVASETADAALDWMQDFLNTSLRREGKLLTTRRYSPGYGDLKINAQQIIYNALDMGKIGVEITDKFILTPEKSVLAIAGVNEVN